MDEKLKSGLQRWESLEGRRDEDPATFDLVDREIDRLLHGDPERGRGIPWSLYTKQGSALRRYDYIGWKDANMRVIVEFVFGKWAQNMVVEQKPFMRGRFPVFDLYVAPDDEQQIGGIELKAIGEHNFYNHETSTRRFDPHCHGDCTGWGYSPIPAAAKPNMGIVLKTLASQDTVYPSRIAIGRDTHLIIGSDGTSSRALVMRRAKDWAIEAADLRSPPSPSEEGPPRREMRRLGATETMLVGELGRLTHDPLWATTDPRYLGTTERWRQSRTAVFTPTDGEPETLTVINSEDHSLS